MVDLDYCPLNTIPLRISDQLTAVRSFRNSGVKQLIHYTFL